ncbi:MAG: hypothetical protein RIC35_12050 [Marinoscillum sp.]
MKSILFYLSCLCSVAITAQSLAIEDVDPQTVEAKAFKLDQRTTVEISGTGGLFRDNYKFLVYYGWIIDAKTRRVVWSAFSDMRYSSSGAEGKLDFKRNIDLDAGSYEMYFTGAFDSKSWSGSWGLANIDDLLVEIFDSGDRDRFRRSQQEDLFMSLNANGLTEISTSETVGGYVKDSFAYFVRAEDEEHFEQGFTLTKPSSIRVYSIGEGRKDEVFDYAWIYDAKTRERVFEMNYRNTRHAGGADKNIRMDEIIDLPAGSYVVNYRTDDSHSYESWNALPPDDPQFWGVALFPATAKDKTNMVEFVAPKTLKPVVELTKIRNYELVSQGFELKKEVNVRLMCLGERDGNDEMADYGWIVDANTRETVWKMRPYRSEHAGGADKNRMVNDQISLPKGHYIAYYRTDGSHAYNSWNSSRPNEEGRWGLTLWAVNESDIDDVVAFDEKDYMAKNVIAEISMVGDNDYRRKTFELSKTTKVTVMALGEGSDGRMNDLAWIKNMDTGRIVWEMEYYDTRHAGGAKKNRSITETLTLPSGEYMLYYESDGSHSFNRWNAAPPDDPQSYGARILMTE